MSKQQYRPSVWEGFNFHKDSQEIIGHLTALKIGSSKFETDLEVQDPTAIEKGTKVKVVGVISAIRWNGGFAEPIAYTCQVSYANAKTAAIQIHQDLSDTSVELQFILYKYDPKEKKYYECFHANKTDLKGLVEKNGGELEYEMDLEEQNREVPSPINFEMYLSVMPQEIEQEIHLAVSVSDKLVKKWGVAGPSGA